MEHILNCHGEWLILIQALAALPAVGVYLRSLMSARKGKEQS